MLTLSIPPFYDVPIRKILFLCQYVQSWRNVVPTFTNVLHVQYLSKKCIDLSEQYMRRFQLKIMCFMKNLSKWSLLGKIPMDTTVLRYFNSDSFRLLDSFIMLCWSKDWYFCKITEIPIQMTKDLVYNCQERAYVQQEDSCTFVECSRVDGEYPIFTQN